MSEIGGEPTLERKLEIGWLRLREHMLNNAELIFQQVLAEAPGHPTALRLLGVTRSKLERHGEAIAHLRAVVVLEPESDIGWCDLAVALRRAGQAQAASEAYDQVVSICAARPEPVRLGPLAEMGFSSERGSYGFTLVDYPYIATIRHGAGRLPHPELAARIGEGRERYAAFLAELAVLQPDFADVEVGGAYTDRKPFWLNAWFPPLDGLALTQMLRRHDPIHFVEIGSGMSTKFARRAIETYGLRTRLISIDPEPRNQVDRLCDQVIRKPLERCGLEMFQALEAGDILFLDSSHRAFQGSDVTVFFLEVLPRLKPGVIVHLHDIYLPDDYISGHLHRMWNEQYLLAVALLFGGQAFEILFPAWYVGQDPALRQQAKSALGQGSLQGLEPYGASFWMRKT